jgi:hypothetical protein
MSHRYVFMFFLLLCTLMSCLTTGGSYSGPTAYCQNGMLVYSDYTYRNDLPGPLDDVSMVLAENWTYPGLNMVFAANEHVMVFSNWQVEMGILVEEWDYPETGMVLKRGSAVWFSASGQLYIFTLARDWKDPQSGHTLKGGTDVHLHDDGTFASITFKHDVEIPQIGMVIKAGKTATFYASGNLYYFTLGKEWKHSQWDLRIKAGTTIVFWETGNFKKYTPAADTPVPGTNIILKKDCEVEWKEDGSLMTATFAQPWKDAKTGTVYEAGKEYSFE